MVPASHDSGGGVWDPSEDPSASSKLVASSSSLPGLLAPCDIPFSQSVPVLPERPVPKISGPQYFKASPPTAGPTTEDDEFQTWYEKKFKKMFKQSTDSDDDAVNYRKQLIPDAFAIQPLPTAANFKSWINKCGPCCLPWH